MATEPKTYSFVDELDKLDGTNYGGEDELEEEVEEAEEEVEEGDEEEAEESSDDDSDDAPVEKAVVDKQQKKDSPAKEKPQLRMLPNGMAVDEKGNIVDPRDGTIIARAGMERRLFDEKNRLRNAVSEKDKQIEELNKRLADIQFLNDVPRKYGFTNDEVVQAFDILQSFKRSPVEGARKVVELALAAGYNASDILGKEAGDAIEMSAINRMLDERLAPLKHVLGDREKESKQQALRQQAEAAMNEWIASREYADVHLPAIDRLIGQNEGMTPDQAYYELKMFAVRNGLDFSTPLGPQIERLKQSKSAPNAGEGRPVRKNTRSLPNGGNAASTRSLDEPNMADPSTEWSDIIRSVMRPRGA